MTNSAAKVELKHECEVKVRTADGREFNLGNPDSKLFKLRLLTYKMKRKIHG